ncbi:CHASE2 domain-containing protein [Qipengyuania nanhaisediminis]|uniref:CHASE2 domain-containing protein n=1 Tax=Qipengyuania nanhaisediminis TaxID=604088 RepID=UPI0038B36FF5
MKATRLLVEWAALLALAIAGAVLLQSGAVTERLDNQLLDKASVFARPAIADDIAIVAIDSRSLAETGAWPWPRSRHAELIRQLRAAGARLVVYDVLFVEPGEPGEDQALAAAMREAGNVILPHGFVDRLNAASGIDPLYPAPPFAAAAAGIGHAAAQTDGDGILRRFDLVFETDRDAFPHAVVTALEWLGEARAPSPESRDGIVPFNHQHDFLHQSASDVIAGTFLPELVTGKVVFVGATALGMGDRYPVATGEIELMAGVEAQANLFNALRAGALITPVSALWQNLVAAAALTALFVAFWFLPPRVTLYVALALVAALLASALALLALGQLWLPVAPAIVVILLAYPVWSWRRLSHVSRYLDREAARMRGDRPQGQHGGMEYVARQVARVRGLIHAIRDRLTFLRQVIEAAPDAIIVLDEEGRVEMLNEQAAQLFAGWEALDAPPLERLLEFARARLQRSQSELVTEDGRTFLVARAQLASGNEAEIGGTIMALREITELRRLDEERNQMLEFLSHDMRTPQVAIIGLTRQQGEAAPASGDALPADALPADALPADAMARIRKQANRTLKLADDFVQLARLENPDLQIEDSDVSALIEEACDRAYVLAEAKHITIAQNLPAEPLFADVDASLIARMLDNLIGNAVKYSPENAQIQVTLASARGSGLQITVADNGTGLPEARLANPFARFGAHVSNAGPSAGLGLALVKKVIDAHGGTIAVASRKGRGTRFTVTLPGQA